MPFAHRVGPTESFRMQKTDLTVARAHERASRREASVQLDEQVVAAKQATHALEVIRTAQATRCVSVTMLCTRRRLSGAFGQGSRRWRRQTRESEHHLLRQKTEASGAALAVEKEKDAAKLC